VIRTEVRPCEIHTDKNGKGVRPICDNQSYRMHKKLKRKLNITQDFFGRNRAWIYESSRLKPLSWQCLFLFVCFLFCFCCCWFFACLFCVFCLVCCLFVLFCFFVLKTRQATSCREYQTAFLNPISFFFLTRLIRVKDEESAPLDGVMVTDCVLSPFHSISWDSFAEDTRFSVSLISCWASCANGCANDTRLTYNKIVRNFLNIYRCCTPGLEITACQWPNGRIHLI